MPTLELRSPILLFVILTNACGGDTSGPEPLEPAELGELCGEAGPVRLLPLEPTRPLAGVEDHGLYEGRRVVSVDYSSEPHVSELWSVGPCGEDPVLLGVRELHMVPRLDVRPDWLIECDWNTGDVWRLDPSGARAPALLFTTDQCAFYPLDEGVLTYAAHDDTTGALRFVAWPDDPWTSMAEPLVILDPVRTQPFSRKTLPGDAVLGVTDDEYLVLRTNEELVAVSRVDGTITTIAEGVDSFDNDRTGRHVVWQSTTVTNPSEMGTEREGLISLTDRQTGVTTPLTESSLRYGPAPFAFEAAGVVYLDAEGATINRFYQLPSLDSVDVVGHGEVLTLLDETHVAVSSAVGVGPIRSFDAHSGETTTLFGGSGTLSRWSNELLTVLENVHCCNEDDDGEEGRLWRVGTATQPELIAERATVGLLVSADGRIVTPVDVDEDHVGSLIVVDPSTLDEQLLDEDVLVRTPAIVDEVEGDPVVLYTVVDPERWGVWLARLPPTP